jgi:hypothetical protein
VVYDKDTVDDQPTIDPDVIASRAMALAMSLNLDTYDPIVEVE